MTFDYVSEINRDRCEEWHKDMHPWTGADWSNAMCGEAGEAANVVKKLRRLETRMMGIDREEEKNPQILIDKLGNEIADTYLYLDLLAAHYDIDMAQVIQRKFNEVSERRGFPHRL
jgi:NTP pyrophosphatase (non-canonical NTP hydrolase)